jgi:hypothetical protein
MTSAGRRYALSLMVAICAISMASCKTSATKASGASANRTTGSASHASSTPSHSTKAAKSSSTSSSHSTHPVTSAKPPKKASASKSAALVAPPVIVVTFVKAPVDANMVDSPVPGFLPPLAPVPPAGSVAPRLTTGGTANAVLAGGATGAASISTSSSRVRCEAFSGERYWSFGVNVDPRPLASDDEQDYDANSYTLSVMVRTPIRSIGDVDIIMSVGPDAKGDGPFSGEENLQESPTPQRITVTPSADSRSVQVRGLMALTVAPLEYVITKDVSFSATITCASIPSV